MAVKLKLGNPTKPGARAHPILRFFLLAAGEQIAQSLEDAGFDVLLDDRDERAGVKFKDADLIGVPFRIAVGKKLAEGKVELLNRLTNQTLDIPISEVTQSLSSLTTHN